ncbi:MAG: F0F1 ATP synthase subunit A [Dehalococcoidia bacterium]|nr:F0F1 ATP synthase subunit A [Dehalococcoidia bacterium]
MPSGAGARRLLLLGGLALLALFVAGLITGAIGTAILRGEDQDPLLPQPQVHLPPQPIFPAEARSEHNFAPNKADEGHGSGDEAIGKKPYHFTPLGMFDFAITNTMLSAWVTTLVLLGIFLFGVRKAKMVPGRLQNLVEMAVEALLGFVEGVIGRDMGRRVFPLIATVFLFVAFNAWIALLPIYPSLGFKDSDGDIAAHLVRSAGTDLNMPLALALVSFVFVEYWGLRMLGFGYLGKFIPVGQFFRNVRRGQLFQAGISLFVGFLEGISELVRVVSFTFRLFGNMTAGEVLVLMAAFLVPFVATVAVYGLELLVGAVQALIFAGLTLVFVTVATTPHEEEH